MNGMPQRVEDLEKKPDEFPLAGIVYLSFFFGSFLFSGIMLAVCHRKGEYARFHMVQTLATQIGLTLLLFVYILAYILLIFLSLAPTIATDGHAPPILLIVLIPLHFCMVFGMVAANVTLGIWGMVTAFQGKDFRIPLVGNAAFRTFFKGKRVQGEEPG